MTNIPINAQLGKYKIKSLIGEGGMATVYLAEDTTLHREVAVKMIRVGEIPPNQLPRILTRFKREAEALARLSDDPAIVTVHDYGEYEDAPYLVMAYMPGGTLKDKLGQPMDYRKAAELLLPVTEALALAHEHGIVHRDVKPSNLLVDRKGNLALADFGIAKALEVDGQTLTGTGMGVGTPEYMAPEQWKGEASPQTDVYALGVVLYEMVTGQKPYSAGTPSEVFLKQMTQPPERPLDLVPGLPEAVELLLDRAMDKEPEARFPNMTAFQGALVGISKEEPAHDETPVAVEKPEEQVAPDPEVTFDELATPSPLGEVPLPAMRTEDKIENPQKAVEGQRKWWLAGVGVIVVGGIVWGLVGGSKKATPTPLAPTLTETAVSTLTLAATETQAPTQTSTATTEPTITVTPAPTLGIGSTIISEKDGMEMVYVPAGEFLMGDDEGYTDERPEHEVYLDAFWIDKTEVTAEMFRDFLNEVGNQGYLEQKGQLYDPEGEWALGDIAQADYPVVEVTWTGARAYCEWAGRRLPTEAEWEKAARGTDGRTYPWGEELSCNYVNFSYDCKKTYSWISKVGSYPAGASPYGALDMAGNAWEWTGSLYKDYPYDASDGRENLDASGTRVLRGGSWNLNGRLVRSAVRGWNYPDVAYYDFFGFRCASSP